MTLGRKFVMHCNVWGSKFIVKTELILERLERQTPTRTLPRRSRVNFQSDASMRSFIRSHKKTNSLDESPTGFVPPAGGDGLAAPEIPYNESMSLGQSTPPHPGSNFQGIKHSPGFESLHKLNKKMFPGKLFKKSTSSNNQFAQPTSLAAKEYSSAPGTPQAKSYEVPGESGARNSNETKRFLAVKGTVTHSWGYNSGSEQQVIVLNSNSSLEKPHSSTQPSTPTLTSDLGPAVRISSIRRGLETTSNYSESSDSGPSFSSRDTYLRQNDHPPHVYSEISRVKNKNRQARIHSHDDIISLGQGSSVTMDFLKSTFSPDSLKDGSPHVQNSDMNGATSSGVNNSNLSTIKRPDFVVQRTPIIKFNGEDGTDRDADAEDEISGYATSEDEEYSADNDDDDTSSKFSFELNAINGRTSSVKYYSKPEPSEAMYIDDMFEDENFDEDMHCLEDDYNETVFPSNDLIFDGDSDNESVVVKDMTLNELSHNDPKPVKKYKDLFELSDEDEDDEQNYELQHDDEPSEVAVNSNQTTLLNNAQEREQDNSFISDKKFQSPIALHSNIPVPITLSHSHSHSSPSTSFPNVVSPVASQPSTQSSVTDEIVPNVKVSPQDKPPIIHVSLSTPSPPVIQTSFPSNLMRKSEPPKNKGIKSFADIFELDDNFSDEENDEDDLIRKAVDQTQGNTTYAGSQGDSNFEDLQSKRYQPIHASPVTRPATPSHIYLPAPGSGVSSPSTPHDIHNHPSSNTPSLPPPARSQNLKYHDLNSNLDYEVPGMMSNLYFIDEKEEDKYIEEHKLADDDYLDEINTVPEDFNFSDSEHDGPTKTSLRRSLKGSFRGTHSYSRQPTGTAKEDTPTRNKLEIKNKTVTFFNNSWENSSADRYELSPGTHEQYADAVDEYIISPARADQEKSDPLTPNNSISKPSPGFTNDKSLSPIQEGSSSVDNSPSAPLNKKTASKKI